MIHFSPTVSELIECHCLSVHMKSTSNLIAIAFKRKKLVKPIIIFELGGHIIARHMWALVHYC